MKVGPVDLPVANAVQLATFALLVVLSIIAARQVWPSTGAIAKYRP